VREGIGADRPAPQSSEREREGGREGARGLAPIGRVRLSGAEGARGAASAGPTWAEMVFFPFSRELLMLFYLFSLGISIQIQTKFEIQTKSNMCNNSKNIWSST
jgi:hypothetical protein